MTENAAHTPDTTPYADAQVARDAAAQAAVNMRNDDLVPDALDRARATAIRTADAAHAEVAAAARAARDALTGPSRADVLTGRAPATADQVAVATIQRAQVQTLLDHGRTILDVIDAADENRVAALLSMVETLPDVLNATEPDALAVELQDRLFDRLVALGEADAVAAKQREATLAPLAAWAAVLTESENGGEVTSGARSALFRADEVGYQRVFASGAAYALDSRAIARLRSSQL
ncbi:hypothetical protein [Curtobacterium sp. VKM Ac-1393]|uniref:hypothetical protein n=1 Tax=Curtobacterium sp. VKM Ac-1393 TaxID=2783814 RepID=UPI00188D23EB|nr:hypothetical protein [Curtobacterium sp. VKM Ac-1393]MBF4606934.1 hypothetical protein [Curtobacterium sp. VKM Ac-1393]